MAERCSGTGLLNPDAPKEPTMADDDKKIGLAVRLPLLILVGLLLMLAVGVLVSTLR